MKTALITMMISAVAITSTACARDEAITEPVTPQVVAAADTKKDAKPADTATKESNAGKTKRVCIKTTDRSGKEIEKCRDVKIHKKLEGTEIPPKK